MVIKTDSFVFLTNIETETQRRLIAISNRLDDTFDGGAFARLFLRSLTEYLYKQLPGLLKERTDFNLSIPVNDQRDFVAKYYDKRVNELLTTIKTTIDRSVMVIFKYDVKKNPLAGITLDDIKTEYFLPDYRTLEFVNSHFIDGIDNNDLVTIEEIEIPPKYKGQIKLKWKGTPSQFGFIIDLLIKGEYLERPTNSFAKDADYYSEIFEIDTTPGTLAKEVSENTNSLNTENRKKFKIPPKKDLTS
jgi:hypothetical protein